MKKKCVYTSGNTPYLVNCLIALSAFVRFNPDYDAHALTMGPPAPVVQALADRLKIAIHQIDLKQDFYTTWEYPIECYYIFYGPVLFHGQYDVAVYIDGDVYCNHKIQDSIAENVNFITAISRAYPISQFAIGPAEFKIIARIWKIPNITQRTQKTICAGTGVVFLMSKL